MSESENSKKNDGVTAMSGGVSVPDDGDNALLKIDSPAGRKFLRTLANGLGAVGPALRARMGTGIRKIGDGKADYIRKVAQAEKEAIDLLGPERASEIVAEADAVNSIRERTDARLNFQEEKRQHNIESVAWQAADKLPENVSEEEVNSDWIARFFESVKDVSDETMQSLWSSALAGEVATPGQTSLRTLDVLKNLSQQDAQEFERVLQFSMDGKMVYYPTNNGEVAPRILPYFRNIYMGECGLIHYESTMRIELNNSQTENFSMGLFLFGIYPMPSHGAFSVKIPVFAISSVGREIARFVPAKFPEPWYLREFAKCLASSNAFLRLESSIAPPAVNNWEGVSTFHRVSPLPGDEANISPTATDEELQSMLENCPCRVDKITPCPRSTGASAKPNSG